MLTNVVDALSEGEGENIEFKSSLSLYDEILKAISAFSNKTGGTIFVGINDSRNVIGIDIGKNTLENLANDVKRETDPSVYPTFIIEEYEDKKVLEILITEAEDKPVFYRDKAYIRVGRSKHKMSSNQIRNLAQNHRTPQDWDSLICETASFKDIDVGSVKKFLENVNYERNLELNPEIPIGEALKRLGLSIDDKLTNAAVLLFAKTPQTFFPQAKTKCAFFLDNEAIDFEDMKIFEGSIIDQRDDTISFIKKHMKRSAEIIADRRIEKWEYPLEAIREAVTNAICHRDYRINSNVQIRIFNDRIEIWGCGPLPVPLTIEDLKQEHTSIPRNPLISECFFKIKFIEQWGTGTQRIIRTCLDYGLNEPLFELKSENLVVTLKKYKISDEDIGKLNERQLKAIEHLLIEGKITNKEYRDINPDIERTTAYRDLKDLINRGLILQIGQGIKTYYVLL